MTNRSTSRAARQRRGRAASTAQAARGTGRSGPSEQGLLTGARGAVHGSSTAQRSSARATAAADEALAPWDRGPVRAYLRDVVDTRRHLLGVLFVPAFGLAMITTFGPASDLQWLLLRVSLVALAAVLVEAVVRGLTYTRMTRAQFPDVQVNAVSSTFYAFMRAHRPRSLRKPPPRTGP